MSKTAKYFLTALMIVSTTAGSSSMVGGGAVSARTSGGEPKNYSKQAHDSRTPVALSNEVRHQLVMLPYYNLFDWLEYEIQPGDVVVLRGQVVRPVLKTDAENAVKRIEGVTKVNNQIEVLPVSPVDDQIRRAVYRVLFNWDSPLFRYALQAVAPIHIIVKNGNVTLKGAVDSQADSDLANIRARGVSGVFAVNNELKVERAQ